MLVGVAAAAPFVTAWQARPAAAALGFNPAGDGGFFASVWEQFAAQPPEAVRFPRPALDLPFAVLLMRSGYDAADELDFIPMDEFQRSFWKLRASEQPAYLSLYSPLTPRVGDLSDPNYFDFVSFAQYATVSKEIPRGRTEFEERCEECEEEGYVRRRVLRDPALGDNAALPAAFRQRVGDKIYAGLRLGFRGTQFGGPEPCAPGADLDQLLVGVRRILDIFAAKGYCLKAEISDVVPAAGGRGGSFTVHLEGPATLWGVNALASRRALALNNYDALALEGYLRASGRAASYRLQRSDTALDTYWTVA